MPETGRNVIRQPAVAFELVNVSGGGRIILVPSVPEGGVIVASLNIATGAPAISARVNVSGNNVVAFIIDGLDSTLFALYGAKDNASTLHPLQDTSGSPIEVAVEANVCVVLDNLLEGFNYFAVLHDEVESVAREITVLTVPRS